MDKQSPHNIPHPLVSIIIPLYNKEKYIKKTLESILKCNENNIEIIIVNDGSKDNSVNIIKEFIDPRIRLIHQDNQGVSAARNHGITEAKSDWIYLLDADDILIADSFNKTIGLLDNKYDIVVTNYYLDAELKQLRFKKKNDGSVTYPFFNMFIGQFDLRTGSIFIKKEIAIKQPFDNSLSRWEDFSAFHRWLTNGRIYYSSIPIMAYNLGSTNLSNVNQDKYRRDYIFHLKFNSFRFWYNCNLGLLLNRGYQEYSHYRKVLNSQYGYAGKLFNLIAKIRINGSKLIRSFLP